MGDEDEAVFLGDGEGPGRAASGIETGIMRRDWEGDADPFENVVGRLHMLSFNFFFHSSHFPTICHSFSSSGRNPNTNTWSVMSLGGNTDSLTFCPNANDMSVEINQIIHSLKAGG